MSECMSDFSQRRRTHLWHDVFRTDRLGNHPSLAWLAGLEASIVCQFAMRRLHRNMSGENQSAPSFAAEPAECGRAKAILAGEIGIQDFRHHGQPTRFISSRMQGRAGASKTASTRARQARRSCLWMDKNT